MAYGASENGRLLKAHMLDEYPGKYMYQHFNINQRDEIFMLIRVEILETGVVLEEDDSLDLSMIVQDIKRIPLAASSGESSESEVEEVSRSQLIRKRGQQPDTDSEGSSASAGELSDADSDGSSASAGEASDTDGDGSSASAGEASDTDDEDSLASAGEVSDTDDEDSLASAGEDSLASAGEVSDTDFFVGDVEPEAEEGEQGAAAEKLLSLEEVARAQRTEKQSGVVYMSRVPPFMKPLKVRHMLEKYARIGRIYLIEEDDGRRKRRVKSGGNRRRQYTEGWIEFKNKKYAKAVAHMLNNQKMGGKRHGFYFDDLWNLKYLPKFKWRHLVEQLASEKAAREQRLQTELSQSRKELDAYMKNVDRAKKISSIRARHQAKADSGQDVQPLEDRSHAVRQRDVVVREADGGKRRRTEAPQMSALLDRIF
ncbi:RNA-binding ATPase activator esf2 [Coemansia sp. RSA 552]|nr:RNA-binding ATPase activator esf2 [Coemansia sp. RSA 552]